MNLQRVEAGAGDRRGPRRGLPLAPRPRPRACRSGSSKSLIAIHRIFTFAFAEEAVAADRGVDPLELSIEGEGAAMGADAGAEGEGGERRDMGPASAAGSSESTERAARAKRQMGRSEESVRSSSRPRGGDPGPDREN